MLPKPYFFFRKCAARYGDPFIVPIYGIKTVFTSQPDRIQQICNANPNLFDAMTGATIGSAVGENSLLVISGAQHERERKLLMPPFHGARLQTYGRLIQDITLKQAAHWQPDQPLIMQQESQDISLEIIIQVVFSIRQPEKIAHFRDIIVALLQAFTPLIIAFPSLLQQFNFGPWGKFRSALADFNQLLDAEIAERRAKGTEGDDILSMLLAVQDEDGQPMTDDQIRDELKTLLLAGHETTASGISWACYWIHRSPTIRDRLRDELMQSGSIPEPEVLTRLPYLKAVCQETLRMTPPVPFALRMLKQPWMFCDYALPAGVGVGIATGVTHFNPEIYPDPETFCPDRFLDRQYSAFEFVPFGGGTRRCLGAAFALYEMQVVLGTMLARHELALAESRPVIPETFSFTIPPKGGVKMIYQGHTAFVPTSQFVETKAAYDSTQYSSPDRSSN